MSANYRDDIFQCKPCDVQFFSKCYLNYSELNHGYWRQTYDKYNKLIYKCQFNHLKSCVGGSGIGNQLCSEGRVGNECQSCDETGQYWNSTQTANGFYSCSECQAISTNNVKIAIGLSAFILILYFIIQSNFNKIQNIIYHQYLVKMNMIFIGTSFTKLGQDSVYIKIVSFHASMIIFFQSQLEINLENTIISTSLEYAAPIQSSFVSINCLLYDIFPNNQNYGPLRLKFYLLLPFIIMPLTLLFPFMRKIFKNSSYRFFKYNIYLIIIYVLFIVFYNQILSICLEALLCRKFGNGKNSLLIDLSIPCQKAKEYYGLSISGILIYSVLIPSYLIYNLYKNRNNLSKIQVLFQFRFLYQEYKQNYYYWEMVRFSLKVLFLIIQKGFFQNIQFMNSLFIIFLFIYHYCLQKYQSFQRKLLNTMELISVKILILSYFSAIIIQSQNQVSSDIMGKLQMIYLYSCLLAILIFNIYNAVLIFSSFKELIFFKIKSYTRFSIIKKCFANQEETQNTERLRKNFKLLRNQVRNIISFQCSSDNLFNLLKHQEFL
ncbi:hypothetical protein ABPG72_005457 [Tetrahymena utriculariae]